LHGTTRNEASTSIEGIETSPRCWRKHARPPVQKEAILPEYILAMVATLPHDLRGLRDRAILLLCYAGRLRRSESVGLDHGKENTPDSGGWIEILEDGAVLTLNARIG